MYRTRQGRLEVFLAHPGGPFFAHKDEGHWTIPKGEIEPGEELLAAALREFKEEIGLDLDPRGHFLDLGSIQQKGGKVVHAWAVAYHGSEPVPCHSCTFEMEWPPHSGKWQRFPEVDRAEFFAVAEAKRKIKPTQIPLLERLQALLEKSR